ncbi:MAG: FmdB family zinc ribbon protein [Dehalococcoidia bacterium]
MPLYEYYCRKCDDRFERLRPAGTRDEPVRCPAGHAGSRPVVSLFASVATMTQPARGETAPERAMGGGCACGGGGCGCGH